MSGGSSQEFKRYIKPKLDDKNLEYYLIRNERVVDFAIYSFEDDNRFEPDFLLLILKKEIDGAKIDNQVYIEPKGTHLLKQDEWKEKFLLEIENKHIITTINPNAFNIVGLPFSNEEERKKEFRESFDKFCKNYM